MPSNMELVTERLLAAYQLEPYRTDLLISAANAQIYNGNLSRAITLLEQAQAVAPDDLDINSYLAIWQLVKGNKEASRSYLAKVADRNSGRAADLERFLDHVAAADDVWVTRRIDIANHWRTVHPAPRS